MKKRILFVDMDGVLADFDGGIAAGGGDLNKMFSQNFFRNLRPLEENLNDNFIELQKMVDVKILSKACVRSTDSRFQGQEQDKINWLREFVPCMDIDNIIIQPTDSSKGEIVEQFSEFECLLIDDYSKNLVEWELSGGLGIKKAKRIKDRPFEQAQSIKELKELLENVL